MQGELQRIAAIVAVDVAVVAVVGVARLRLQRLRGALQEPLLQNARSRLL